MGHLSKGQQQATRKQDGSRDLFLQWGSLPFGEVQNRERSLPRKFSISRLFRSIGGETISSNINYQLTISTPAISRFNGRYSGFVFLSVR
jgi:hypothetical protein